MKPRVYLVLVIAAIIFTSSCSNLSLGDSNGDDAVVIEDSDFGDEKDDNEDVTLFDSDFELADGDEDSTVKSKKSEAQPEAGEDDSKLTTMFDGVGNKIEVRQFNKHSLIKKIIIRTSVKGKTKVFVYAQNGKVRRLAKRSSEEIKSATGSEIATMAQIYETREERDSRRAQIARNRAQEIESKRSDRSTEPASVANTPVETQDDSRPEETKEDSETPADENEAPADEVKSDKSKN